jgi:Flp pilus assembly protein TadG
MRTSPVPRRRLSWHTITARRKSRGQSMVEFALTIPIVLVVIVSLIEFAFVSNAFLSINYASRDAALIAAEAGNANGADCVILKKVDEDVTAPADPARITQVTIFQADQNGDQVGSAVNTYARTGSTTCNYPDNTSLTVPYSLSGAAGYPETQRCNVLAGCPLISHATLDMIGIQITYDYRWHTPFPGMVPLLKGGSGPGGTGWTLVKSNAMRMEPVL